MNNRLRSFVSSLLLACFAVYLVPHELVHGLYGHVDTKHNSLNAERSVGEKHVHCAFLTYEAPPFDQTTATFAPVPNEIESAFVIADQISETASTLFYNSLRGPPAC